MWLWYADRGSALVAYVALWLAVLMGILYNAKRFGAFHELARKSHVPVSVLALATLLAHAAFGIVDGWLVLAGDVPHPNYSDAYLLLGILVGIAALLLLITATLGFLDAKKFQRPWDPRTVHALAYAGFAFATIHAVAVGTDLFALAKPAVAAGTIVLVGVLAMRWLGSAKAPATP